MGIGDVVLVDALEVFQRRAARPQSPSQTLAIALSLPFGCTPVAALPILPA